MNIFFSLSLVLALMISSNSRAQFNFQEGPDVFLNISQSYETVEVSCTPDSIHAMSINWKLLEIGASIPQEWEFTICDNVCYPFFPSIGNPIPFSESDWSQGAKYKLKLGVSTNGVNGEGQLAYLIYDYSDSTLADTVQFHLLFESASIGEPLIEFPVDIKIYTERIQLINLEEGLRSVSVFGMNGAVISRFKLFDQQTSISLTNGVYYIIIDDRWRRKIVINK